MADEPHDVLYLGHEAVVAAGGLDMAAAMRDVEHVHRLKAEGAIDEPSPLVIPLGSTAGHRLVAHAAFIGADINLGGVKWIPANPANPAERGIPRAIGLLVLTDPETALPIAIVEGTAISAVRTGASVGVAATALARPDAATVAVIGAGAQAHTELMALKLAMPHLKDVRVYDVRTDRAHAFATTEGTDQLSIQVAETAKKAIETAEVVVVATVGVTRGSEYIPAEWLSDDALFIAVSAFDAAPSVLEHSELIVTSTLAEVENPETPIGALAAAGRIDRHKCVELGALIKNPHDVPLSRTKPIYYSLYGLSAFDIAVAERIVRTARARGIGETLRLWAAPMWT